MPSTLSLLSPLFAKRRASEDRYDRIDGSSSNRAVFKIPPENPMPRNAARARLACNPRRRAPTRRRTTPRASAKIYLTQYTEGHAPHITFLRARIFTSSPARDSIIEAEAATRVTCANDARASAWGRSYSRATRQTCDFAKN